MSLQKVLETLKGVRKSGDGWVALCPAHSDRNPSLSINERNGKILLHCHANCTIDSICASLFISPSDLFTGNGSSKIVAAYDYVDEQGRLLYQNVRYEPKDFRMRRPDGNGGWLPSLGGVRRVPYHLPQIIASDFVLIVEGEKDAETAARLGIPTTSSKHWRVEFSEFLRDRNIAIIADADEAGRKTAGEVAQGLLGKVSSLKALELPGSKDLSDWIEGGGNRDALLGFIEIQPEWKPSASWREIFHSFSDFENAPPLSFAIKDFIVNDGATLVGGLSEHGKTLVMLSVAKALLRGAGHKLWGHFDVLETAERVIYLIPESSIGPFKHRLQLFGLYKYLQSDRLLVRTLSLGATPSLSDLRILSAARGAHVFLDTAVRFGGSEDENSATANQRGLAADIFALLAAGARTVIGAHHSPKGFGKENVMTLENVLRGTGDLGAMCSAVWGVKKLDSESSIVHVENVKARDFMRPKPFQLIGRPHIDQEGDFRMHKAPGECGSLMDEQEPERDKGGASIQARETRAANMELMRQFLRESPHLNSQQISQRFKSIGVQLGDSSVRKYRKELGL